MPWTPSEIPSRTPSPLPWGAVASYHPSDPPGDCVPLGCVQTDWTQPLVFTCCYLMPSREHIPHESCAWRRRCSRKIPWKQKQTKQHADGEQRSNAKHHHSAEPCSDAREHVGGQWRPGAKQPIKENQGPTGPPNRGAPVPGQRNAIKDNAVDHLPQVAPSFGSFGHPTGCSKPCKYFWKNKGCKDESCCTWCHLCEWRGKKKVDSQASPT